MAERRIQDTIQFLRRLINARDRREVSDHDLLKQFVQAEEPTAFETLMHRHGPMVLNVCRRILTNETDVEDAFQATFLVLAKKAAAIQNGELLANWLHGVAQRTSLKARVMLAKRAKHEFHAAIRHVEVEPPTSDADLRAIIDQEIQKLPAQLRHPILLCYLQGKSREEAALSLGVTAGSVKGRLERGRELLRQRLNKRGVACTSAALLGMLSAADAHAVPAAMMTSTLGAVFGASATPMAAMLAGSLINSWNWTKAATSLGAILLTAVLGVGVGYRTTDHGEASANIATYRAESPQQEADASPSPPPVSRTQGSATQVCSTGANPPIGFEPPLPRAERLQKLPLHGMITLHGKMGDPCENSQDNIAPRQFVEIHIVIRNSEGVIVVESRTVFAEPCNRATMATPARPMDVPESAPALPMEHLW